jgi:hypothetical protein
MFLKSPLRLPPFHFDADPDSAFHFDADPVLDPTFHSDPDADLDPIFQFNAVKIQILSLTFTLIWTFQCSK